MTAGTASVTRLWPPSMTTGIPEIDREHRHLAGLFAKLHEALHGNRRQRAARLIQRLRRKLAEHFTGEPKLLETYGYRPQQKEAIARRQVSECLRHLDELIQAGEVSLAATMCEGLVNHFSHAMAAHATECKMFFRDKGIMMALEIIDDDRLPRELAP